ncbi:hypothetical protein [Noviherbaspirillum sp.]|uniref:hypothetical protein n=1 Tax=Noviherbaspirillum sp. TaxID=1926288 RepID=UPI002FE33A3F
MRRPSANSHRVLFAILVAALVCAQWLGLQHRIAHAGLSGNVAHAPGQAHDPDITHSCALFDAAATADTLHVPPYIAPLMNSSEVLARWAAFISWDPPVALSFSSRAPPIA